MKRYKLIHTVQASEIGDEYDEMIVKFPSGETCMFDLENFFEYFHPVDESFSELDDFPETETIIKKGITSEKMPSHKYRLYDTDGLSVYGFVEHNQLSFQEIQMLGFDESGNITPGAHSEQLIMILLDRLKYAHTIDDKKKAIIENSLRMAMETIIKSRLDILSNQ